MLADGDLHVLVMELLEGESLLSRLSRQRLKPDDVLAVARQVGDAIQAAHDAGIVHRDLKPANIFVRGKQGAIQAKVLDFGISKMTQTDGDAVGVTTTGQLLGTPLYLSPEQSRGESALDARVDVYALGVMLFEMFAGEPPFRGENAFQLLWQHGNEPPPALSSRWAESPTALDEVIARALAKDRDERWSSVAELVAAAEAALKTASAEPPDALGEVAAQGDVPTTAQAASGRRGWIFAIAAALGAILLLVVEFSPASKTPEMSRPPTTSSPAEASPRNEPSTVTGARIALTGTAAPVSTAPSRTPSANPAADLPGPDDASITLDVTPAGTRVSIDGEDAIPTPEALALPIGQAATLVFRRAGFESATHRIEPEDDAILRVRLRRRAPASSAFPIKRSF